MEGRTKKERADDLIVSPLYCKVLEYYCSVLPNLFSSISAALAA